MYKNWSLYQAYARAIKDTEGLEDQLGGMLERMEALEKENSGLHKSLNEEQGNSEETRAVTGQRIARLESYVEEYEKEVDELVTVKTQLEGNFVQITPDLLLILPNLCRIYTKIW